MIYQPNDAPGHLTPGVRVQLRSDMLQAFYGLYGTVVQLCRCPRDGHIARVNVQMDDLPVDEGYAVFYPDDLLVLGPLERAD